MTIFGVDTLGGVKYQEALKALPKECALGFFAEEFTTGIDEDEVWLPVYQLAEKKLKRGHAVRVQLCWKSDHSYGAREEKRAKELMVKYKPLTEKYIGLFVSPFCEHKILSPDKFLNELEAIAPKAKLVNTPLPGGGLSKGFINEIHGEDRRIPKGLYFYSYDGTASVDSDVERMKRIHKNAEIFFMWTYQCNGSPRALKPGEKKIPIPARKAWANKDLLKSLWALTEKKGPAKLAKNTLWKSHAEQTDNKPIENDPKWCKPICITPEKVQNLELRKENAGGTTRIIRSSGRLPYADGRYRYYFSGNWGYELSGSWLVYAGDKLLGEVDCAFRENEWRS